MSEIEEMLDGVQMNNVLRKTKHFRTLTVVDQGCPEENDLGSESSRLQQLVILNNGQIEWQDVPEKRISLLEDLGIS